MKRKKTIFWQISKQPFTTQLTTIKAAILYILQLKRMLREEDTIRGEEQEEEEVEEGKDLEKREIRDEHEGDSRSKKPNNAPLESPYYQHSAELEKLPPMTVLKPPHDIQYLQQVLPLSHV